MGTTREMVEARTQGATAAGEAARVVGVATAAAAVAATEIFYDPDFTSSMARDSAFRHRVASCRSIAQGAGPGRVSQRGRAYHALHLQATDLQGRSVVSRVSRGAAQRGR